MLMQREEKKARHDKQISGGTETTSKNKRKVHTGLKVVSTRKLVLVLVALYYSGVPTIKVQTKERNIWILMKHSKRYAKVLF